MDAKRIIKDIMVKTGVSQEKLAVRCGMKGQTNVTGILNRYSSLRVDKLDQMIRAMGYKIVIVPDGVNVKDGWYEVDTDPENPEKSKKGGVI